jgi:hypothetical protein
MSNQQINGVVDLSLGVAALIESIVVAWMLLRFSRAGRVKGVWFITTAGLMLFVLGIVLCLLGVSALLGR